MILLWMALLLLQGFVGRADVDGPYVLYDSVGRMHVVRVDDGGRVLDSVYAGAAEGQSLYVASQDGRHRFRVRLRAPRRPAWETPQAERTLVISDPHGDLDCLVSVLRNNGVIGADYEWTFGRNQLVVIGDVFDRGMMSSLFSGCFINWNRKRKLPGGLPLSSWETTRRWCCGAI